MDDLVATFVAVTGVDSDATARQYLNLTNNDLEYAVTLYMELNPPPSSSAPQELSDDALLAQKLQQEAYQGQEDVREADATVHRHETLVDLYDNGFSYAPPQPRPTDIFGTGRVGIFNQRFDEEEQDYYESRDYEMDGLRDLESRVSDESASDSDEPVVVGEDGVEPPRARRRLNRAVRDQELTSTQRRLAQLFKPPFDIMARLDLDSAKVEGRQRRRWLLVNIQDATEFQCQVINRDFWADSRVKARVKDSFIFLQYQHDLPHGASYVNFYGAERFPHLLILDPLTGERVYKWTEGEVPPVEPWLDDVDRFLERFLLAPGSSNPIVTHEPRFDPDALSEEQQIEFAMKQSIQNNTGTSAANAISLDDEEAPTIAEPTIELPTDAFSTIQPVDHAEPTEGAVTRIQIRFPNGKRLIRKFGLASSKVSSIYEWLKFILLAENDASVYGLGPEDRFNLSNVGSKAKLIDSLDQTIEEAGLKNASVLLEKE